MSSHSDQSQQNSQETPENQPSDEEIRQAIIARRREQLKNNPEARRKANGVSKKLLAGALAATILLSGLVVNSVNKRDVLESDYAKRQITEMENVEEKTHSDYIFGKTLVLQLRALACGPNFATY